MTPLDLTAIKWAMEPAHIRSFISEVQARSANGLPDQVPEGPDAEDGIEDGRATITIDGPMLTQVPTLYTLLGIRATDLTQTREAVASAVAAGAHSITLRINSPGGSVTGTAELADEITAARAAGVQVTAEVNGLAASAAYWVASAADTIVATKSSQVGSIGIYAVIPDTSSVVESEGVKLHVVSSGGAKGGDVDGAPVTEEYLAAMQRLVDSMNANFVEAVMDGRSLTEEQVAAVNTGEVWLADEAKALGLIDDLFHPQAAASANQEKEARMKGLLDLVAANPDHAELVRDMSAAGKDMDEIAAAIDHKKAEASAAATAARMDELEAANQELIQKLEASEAKNTDLEAKLSDLNALQTAGDPGAGEGAPEGKRRRDMSDSEREAYRREHGAAAYIKLPY